MRRALYRAWSRRDCCTNYERKLQEAKWRAKPKLSAHEAAQQAALADYWRSTRNYYGIGYPMTYMPGMW